MMRNSSGVLSSPIDRTVNSRRSLSMRPAGTSTFRLRIASEILQLGTWEYDVLVDQVFLSERSRAIFGMTSDEKVPLSVIVEAIIETDRQRVMDAVQRAFKQEDNGKFDQEFKVINRMFG